MSRSLEQRVVFLEGHIAGLKIMNEGIREGIIELVEKVQVLFAKRMEQTAVRKGLDIGDEYAPANPGASLDDAVLSRLMNPTTVLNNGHSAED